MKVFFLQKNNKLTFSEFITRDTVIIYINDTR